MSEVRSLAEILNLKCEIQSQKSKIRSLMFEVWPRAKVWSRSLTSVRSLSEVCHKSENCLKSVWSGLHDGDPHWSAVLLILITYIIMYFLSLFGYIRMFVFVVWQINCPSLWVWRLYDVRQWRLQSDVWSTSEVHNPKSENWCLKSTIGSLMYEVWRNPKFDVQRLSENCLNYVQSLKYYVFLFKTRSPKTKVWSTKYVQSPKSESETKVLSLSAV